MTGESRGNLPSWMSLSLHFHLVTQVRCRVQCFVSREKTGYYHAYCVCKMSGHTDVYYVLVSPPGLLEQASSTVSPETYTVILPTSTSATFSEWSPEQWPASSFAWLSIALVAVVFCCSLPSSLDYHRYWCWPSLHVSFISAALLFTISQEWHVSWFK